MSKLPMAKFKTMDKLLHRLGFSAVRQKGGHVFLSSSRWQNDHPSKSRNQEYCRTSDARDFTRGIHFP